MRRLLLLFLCVASPALADPPKAETVTATQTGGGWRFNVTITHPDTGWDHYADGWEVLDADGARLGFRELLHPHVTEQPFTRSLSGVSIPAGTTEVFVRTRCNVDGWSEETVSVSLPQS